MRPKPNFHSTKTENYINKFYQWYIKLMLLLK